MGFDSGDHFSDGWFGIKTTTPLLANHEFGNTIHLRLEFSQKTFTALPESNHHSTTNKKFDLTPLDFMFILCTFECPPAAAVAPPASASAHYQADTGLVTETAGTITRWTNHRQGVPRVTWTGSSEFRRP